jgi:hypothetical protein
MAALWRFQMECNVPSGSRQGQDFQIFRMLSFVFYDSEMKKVDETISSHWSHLNELGRGSRSKTFGSSSLSFK